MQVEEVQALIANHIPGSHAEVRIEGNHVHLAVVSDQFEGLGPVKKQQLVYGALNEAIADGRIHAVHMQTYTPAEWQQLQS